MKKWLCYLACEHETQRRFSFISLDRSSYLLVTPRLLTRLLYTLNIISLPCNKALGTYALMTPPLVDNGSQRSRGSQDIWNKRLTNYTMTIHQHTYRSQNLKTEQACQIKPKWILQLHPQQCLTSSPNATMTPWSKCTLRMLRMPLFLIWQ